MDLESLDRNRIVNRIRSSEEQRKRRNPRRKWRKTVLENICGKIAQKLEKDCKEQRRVKNQIQPHPQRNPNIAACILPLWSMDCFANIRCHCFVDLNSGIVPYLPSKCSINNAVIPSYRHNSVSLLLSLSWLTS